MPNNLTIPRHQSQALKAQQSEAKYFQQLRREQKRDADKILLNVIKRTSKVGLYVPKEIKLTKYRRYRANKALKEFGDLLDPAKFFFVKAEKKHRKTVLERAASLQFKASKWGLFVPREGYKTATLKYSKGRNEPYVVRAGKTKRGPNKGRRYKSIIPLASLDQLEKERDRIRQLAKKLGPLGRNDRMTFKISGDGLTGASHRAFKDVDRLLRDLDNYYEMNIAARINFYRHITLEKTTNFVYMKKGERRVD